MKVKKECELEQMEEEMARLKKAEEQKKTLKPARFVRNPKDVEKEAEVASANVTLSSVSSVSLSTECDQQQQKKNLCCAGDYLLREQWSQSRLWHDLSSLPTVMPLRLLRGRRVRV